MENFEKEGYLSSYCKEKLERLKEKIMYEKINYYNIFEMNKINNNKISKQIRLERIDLLKEEYERLYESCVYKRKI